MKDLKNKTVLITGAAGGLGEALVNVFLQEGSLLILTDINEIALNKLVNQIEKKEQLLSYFTCDISLKEGIEKIYAECKKAAPCIDILVNNAGVAVVGSFAKLPEEKWEKLMEINLLAPMRLTYKFLQDMTEKKSGHIVNISSVAGIAGAGPLIPYSASKFGLAGFGESLYMDIFCHNINVTNVYPFFTRTNILDSEQFGLKEKIVIPDFMVGKAEDVARETIKGIKNNKLHVFPGLVSRLIYLNRRFFPSLMFFLGKRYRKSREKQYI